MPDSVLPPVLPDLFDRTEAADPSPRSLSQIPSVPDSPPNFVQEARPGYSALTPPYYSSADGKLRLYQADSLDLLRRMRDESVDMIFADPPYFLSNGGITCVGGRMVRVDKGGWDKSQGIIGDHSFNLLWLDQCRRILKPNGTIWVTGTSHNIHSVGYALQVLDYKILNDIAWYKINPPPNLACRYFTHATESIIWAAKSVKSKHTFNYPLMKELNGGKQMKSLWEILPPGKSEKRFGKHPTQKPEALLWRIVAASTQPGEIVLDPFCGSATTGVACARLGRQFIGIEREEEYLMLAENRLREVSNPATLVFVFAETSSQTSENGAFKTEAKRMTWHDTVVFALTALGGEGDLKEINRVVAANQRVKSNPTWPSTVRRTVRQSPQISAVGRGRYKLCVN